MTGSIAGDQINYPMMLKVHYDKGVDFDGDVYLTSTEVHINLEQALFTDQNDEFHVKVAKTIEEACKLAEVGFEYFTTIDDVQIFRKRK